MSVIYGTYRREGTQIVQADLADMGHVTARYGPDGGNVYVRGAVGMGFQAFYTHDRLSLEEQPLVDGVGNMIVFDGRLDNFKDIADALGVQSSVESDSTLVFMAFARWGLGCFSRLVGDWAVVIWSHADRKLILARDHAGTRALFYRLRRDEIRWSSYLETFFSDDLNTELDREYVACLLSSSPGPHLTPYKEIRAVPPAHFVEICNGRVMTTPHWHWVANSTVTHSTDAEYDEHFLHLFRQAVMRRTVSGKPIVAELSGGMDSTSIVCMADQIAKEGGGGSDLIDTISYYDDSEPNWDERPFFTKVEALRGKRGIHLDTANRVLAYQPLVMAERFYPYPGADSSSPETAELFADKMGIGGHKVILSGHGGDELLGGVPTPMPALANLLRFGHLLEFTKSASEWCMVSRQPLLHTAFNAARYTASLYWQPLLEKKALPWVHEDLLRFCVAQQFPRPQFDDLLSVRPSAIANGDAWWSILLTSPHSGPPLVDNYEFRYPYLDRDLVEFLHRIPREQLIRPGRRRYLMRRALKGVVPEVILERKRKAFMSHGPLTRLRNARGKIEQLFEDPLCTRYGLVDKDEFLRSLHGELTGELKWLGRISKTIGLELWLRGLQIHRDNLVKVNDSMKSSPAQSRAHKLRVASA